MTLHYVQKLCDFLGDLTRHLQKNQIEFLQFSFRWMNNILMREIPLRATIRLWDTYLVCRFFNQQNKRFDNNDQIFRVSAMDFPNFIPMFVQHFYVCGQGSYRRKRICRFVTVYCKRYV